MKYISQIIKVSTYKSQFEFYCAAIFFWLLISFDESDNVDGEKQNKSAKRKMRKDVRLDETESLEIDQSNEREDELGQENNVSAEKRKSRKKKRKSEKKVRRNETVDHYVEANDDSDQKSGMERFSSGSVVSLSLCLSLYLSLSLSRISFYCMFKKS